MTIAMIWSKPKPDPTSSGWASIWLIGEFGVTGPDTDESIWMPGMPAAGSKYPIVTVSAYAGRGHASMAVASNSNNRLGMSTLPQTFEHALIASDFSKLHRADKSSQPTCEGRTINGGCWCGSGGLLTTASHQGSLLYRRESSSEQPSDYFFFLTKAPMIRVTTEITQSQPSNTVKSNFLDEAKLFWIKRISDWIAVKACAASTSAGMFFG